MIKFFKTDSTSTIEVPLETLLAEVKIIPRLNLLAHAQIEQVDLGSQCGGHGVCGKDRVRVNDDEGLTLPNEVEKKHLTEQEIASGIRLACQCHPIRSGLELKCHRLPKT